MKTIYIFDKNTDILDSVAGLNVELLIEQSRWLAALPKTKRGNAAFRMKSNRYSKSAFGVTFVRREDATAFRLKYGL
jgi:hypothetical protein